MAIFNLIYGKSGTGKSEYIYKDIDKKIDKFKNIYIIVPEQSNLTSERKFFEITGRKSLFNVEVLTLSRMAYRVAIEVGGEDTKLSKIGKSMIIYDLLSKNKNNLNFLGKSEKNIDVVDKMFTELKKHNISLEKLNSVELSDKYTSLKLNDIKLLYDQYESFLNKKYIDENDTLTILAQNIKKSNLFENSSIYIDDFYGFTPQEYCIFEELIKKVDEISVSICLDAIESSKSKESDVFYFNRIYAKKLLKISENAGLELNLINLDKNHRLKNEELKYVEKLLCGEKVSCLQETKNIELFLANSPYSEIENVAQKIYDLVKNNNYKYSEIGIITNDTENYAEDAKVIFRKYNIPIFIDEKKDLNQNVLIKFIINLLDIYSSNWSFESMFNYLKSGLLNINYEDIYLLENYCNKWGIYGSKWYKREFNYEPLNERQEDLEKIRNQIIESLLKLKSEFDENKTVNELTKCIYQFLIDNNILTNLDNKIKKFNDKEINNEYNTSYKILIEILEEMVNLFGDEKITFNKYKDLLSIGIKSSELGKIPATQEQVILGDIDRTRSNKIKVLFVLGMNDGNFPKINTQEGYFNDQDRDLLKENGIELAKNSIDSMYESNFNTYRTFTLPEEKLYLSYCSSDKEGKSIRPSMLIKKLKRCFYNLKQNSDIIEKKKSITNYEATFEQAMIVYKEYLDGNALDKNWEDILKYFYIKDNIKVLKAISGVRYTNRAEKIKISNIKKMYGSCLKTTISRLENYRKCPFSFHMTYGLKLKENDSFQITSLDTGSFMHEVIDNFFEYVDDNNINIKEISDDEVIEIVNKIVEEILKLSKYYIFTSSTKFKIMVKKLKRVIVDSMKYIVYSLKYSDFKPIGHEVEFGDKSEYKPIKMTLDSGENVEIIGKIDRVDIGKLNDKEFVRIIDYKSQIKRLDLKQVETGLQIQLITYLDAITKKENFEPAGMLYLGLIDNIVKSNKNLSEDEIEKQIKKSFKMQGLLIADVNIVKMMDNKLTQGYSDIVPAFIDKEGNLSQRLSSAMPKDEFEKLQNTVNDIIKKMSSEILEGKIDIKPYNYNKKTGCDYCKYKSICMFNTNIKGNEYDYI